MIWIDAKTKLPPPSDPLNIHRVLIHVPLFDFGADDGIRFGYYFAAVKEWRVEGFATKVEADYWMPLPRRPAGRRGNE